MSIDKTQAAFEILTHYPDTRGDGHGMFLNKVSELYYGGKPDFREFVPESWTRSRRKVQEQFPTLDARTGKTKEAEQEYRDLFSK